MSSHTKRVGDIGETSIFAKLLRYDDVVVSRPITDNEPYDCIVDVFGRLYKIQIKTCEKVVNDCMTFQVNVTNPFKKKKRLYTKEEVDIFLLYCVENNYCGLMLFDEYKSFEVKIRLSPPNNFNLSGIRWYEDYDMDKRLNRFINTKSFDIIPYESPRLLEILNNIRGCKNSSNLSIATLEARKSSRVVKRPETYSDFIEELAKYNNSMSAMGRAYGVSGNAIKKWKIFYEKYEEC